jgi:hypothetical protein
MKRRLVFFAGLAWSLAATCTFAQPTIVYSKGPALELAAAFGPRGVDLDLDGATDYTFFVDQFNCDLPTNPCTVSYLVAGGTNELLTSGGYALIQPLGTRIGPLSPQDARWSAAEVLSVFHTGPDFSRLTSEPFWLGSLADQGIGYLGVRFHAQDGTHYGWIRIRLPADTGQQLPPGPWPTVMEWAYDTRPDNPIATGDTGAETIEFKMEFATDGLPHGVPQGGDFIAGRANLSGTTVSYELRMSGAPTDVEFRGPEPPPRGRTLAHLEFPFIRLRAGCILCRDVTLYFGETSLNPGQARLLKMGKLYVSLAEGTVIGRIVPVDH